ncbi:methyltransferase domain-containing protein [Maribacter aestuarii]|uniref:methyltransferase domain-containing protein n=1 Tax=Maribacter aestuarii TaxID=1130723 RepID=UPI00248CD7FB|nr:methyltransferase domain-containing protein [Maribacter aestuarii]
MIDFTKRHDGLEIMDNFQDSRADLPYIFKDINRVNHILGGNDITVNAVFKLIGEVSRESYTILDMGCGDGYMLKTLAVEARKRNIPISFIGVDLNGDALTLARQETADFPEISYTKKDILGADFSDFNCDIVITTLTMHHFENEEILSFLKRFIQLATIGVVINDLERSVLAYYLFQVFGLIFIKTKVAKIDGSISIRKGFKREELELLAKKIPDVSHEIKWKWAFRYVWIMRKRRLTNI